MHRHVVPLEIGWSSIHWRITSHRLIHQAHSTLSMHVEDLVSEPEAEIGLESHLDPLLQRVPKGA